MGAVAGERSITLKSTLFARGAEQFETNLDALLARYERAGIPVFIGTLASNERDQMPLAILAGADTEAASTPRPHTTRLRMQRVPGISRPRETVTRGRGISIPFDSAAPSVFSKIVAQVAARRHATLSMSTRPSCTRARTASSAPT